MFRNNLVPTPPPELRGMSLTVEYTSLLSQAMKTAGVTSIEKLTSFVGAIATGKPAAADYLDEDEAVVAYADAIGAPEKLIRDKRVVEQMRADAQKRNQMMQMAQMAAPAADTAKKLSETDMGKDSALSRMANGMQNIAQQGGQQ